MYIPWKIKIRIKKYITFLKLQKNPQLIQGLLVCFFISVRNPKYFILFHFTVGFPVKLWTMLINPKSLRTKLYIFSQSELHSYSSHTFHFKSDRDKSKSPVSIHAGGWRDWEQPCQGGLGGTGQWKDGHNLAGCACSPEDQPYPGVHQ